MNPIECDMSELLNKKKSSYNFFQAWRSGVSLIEAMEISRYLKEQFKPAKQLVFVKEGDIEESLVEMGRKLDITQYSAKKGEVDVGLLKSPKLKLILYNFKTLYYFWPNISKFGPRVNFTKAKANTMNVKKSNKEVKQIPIVEHTALMNSITSNYDTENFVFFLHTESDEWLAHLFQDAGLMHYQFKADEPLDWRNSKNDESHWSCYGFEQASNQVIDVITK
jgi:hypothetical protein